MPTFEFRLSQDFALCRKKGGDNLAAKNEARIDQYIMKKKKKRKKKTGQADQLVTVSSNYRLI